MDCRSPSVYGKLGANCPGQFQIVRIFCASTSGDQQREYQQEPGFSGDAWLPLNSLVHQRLITNFFVRSNIPSVGFVTSNQSAGSVMPLAIFVWAWAQSWMTPLALRTS